MSDRITITGIRAHGRHGVLDYERANGQEFTVDVVLTTDTAHAAMTDDLSQTIDYAAVAILVNEHVTGEPVALLETLAERIADDILATTPAHAVTVTVHKPQAPIPVPFDDVTISIDRVRT